MQCQREHLGSICQFALSLGIVECNTAEINFTEFVICKKSIMTRLTKQSLIC